MHINVKHKCFHCLMLTVLCFVWLCVVVLNGFRLSDDVNAQQETEPVFYHTPCFDFFDDEVLTSGASAIMDFTPGAGYLLWAAVLRGVPAVGVCMSEQHKEMLTNHLLSMALKAMTDESSDLHDPRLVELLGNHGETAVASAIAAAAAKAKAAVKGKAKAKGKGKGKAKSKAKPKVAAESEEEEDPELDEEEGEAVAVAGSPSTAAGSQGEGTTPTSSSSPAEARLLAKLAAMSGGR